jgi:hypothetical protein
MKRFIIRLAVALLAFCLGVSARISWERRQEIVGAFVEMARDYQD